MMGLEEKIEFELDTLKKIQAYLRAWTNKEKTYENKGMMSVEEYNILQI